MIVDINGYQLIRVVTIVNGLETDGKWFIGGTEAQSCEIMARH